ncbi:MAG TPA: choice-of-anchor D domain-containing protein, partial [Acidimicrobiales bacterium]|nr:choice-of-anchor D domain-containing protein [Acidimicrobiales bacterium]
FTPTATGSRNATLTFTDNAAGSPQTITLNGTGIPPAAPAVTLNPATVSFASQLVSTTSGAQTVTLTNGGNAPLSIASIGLAGANPGDFAQSNTCPLSPATVAAGASCTISVAFGPKATGSRTASLSIADNAVGSPHGVNLGGTGSLPPGTYLSDGFENGLGQWVTVGTSTPTVESSVVNSGTRAAALANSSSGQYVGLYADLAGGGQTQSYSRFCFDLSGLSGPTVLAQGRDLNGNNVWEVDYDSASKGLDIYFWNGARVRSDLYSPANLILANSWYCAEVQANETAAGHGQVWLNGTSVAQVNTDLSVTNGYSRLLLWNNPAAGTVFVDDIQVASAYNGPVGAGATPLPGPAVSLNPATVTFASQPVSTTSGVQTVTLTNTGNAPLTIASIGLAGANPGDFALTTTCPLGSTSLAAAGSCTSTVTFTPTATGSRNATLTFTDNAAGSPQTITLNGTGT